jgi:hypothetical protein
LETIEIKNRILAASHPVMRISSISPDQWYRKPSGPRRGPWYSCNYVVLDDSLWKRREECIYFVRDENSELRYVGISVNRLADRWRSSPAYNKELKSLGKNELFHSQCWPEICAHHSFEKPSGYTVSVLHGKALMPVLRDLNHPLSCLSSLSSDPDIAVIALEVWFVKRFDGQLWNKRK